MHSGYRRRAALLATVCAAVGLSGCGGGGVVETSSGRVVNAVVGVPTGEGLDVSVRSDFVARNLTYGEISPTFSMHTGSADIGVFQTATQSMLFPMDRVDLEEDKLHTLAIAGVVGAQGPFRLHVLRLTDTLPTLQFDLTDWTKSQSAFRVVNLSPDSTSVSFRAQLEQTLQVFGLNNVSYGNSSGFVAVPTQLNVLVNDKPVIMKIYHMSLKDELTGVQLWPSSGTEDVELYPGRVYTVYVLGMRNPAAGQQPLTVKVALDN